MLTINPVKTNNNINFQGKTRIRAIKYIPNITCACCGKKLILPDNLAKAWKSISKPISFIMKKGLLDKWTKRSDSIAAILNKFVQTEPDKPLEKILDNQENYHEFKNALLDYVKSRHPDSDADTNDEYVNRVLDSIRKNSREILKGASPVMKRLAVFKKNLHGLKRDIFEQFQIYAEKYPRKTLSEIVNMDEIYKFHSAKNFLQRAETRERLDYHFGNIKKMIVKQKPELADFADDLKEKALKIYAAEADPKIKFHKMKELYMEALESNNLAKLKFKAADELAVKGIDARVVSIPSFEIFNAPDEAYKESVLPNSVRKRVAVEALTSFGWYQYVGLDGKVVSLDTFGASGNAATLFEQFGFTVENVVNETMKLFS